ncbi:MAG: phospholipase D family protein [Candidatus Delongbacteria bacterium]|nr:phospholipase D family protein [bacterium]MBL7033230.1 phospholipase D family protein [Candidatus Delongbacteria bacterium]
MTKFLTTTGVSFRLEEIIKGTEEKLILISPFLKINERTKELLEDKDRMKIDIRVVYGKNELQPEENNWLKSKTSIRTSFCKNLHAKCYLNEKEALITSMNLYEFSQVNNNEMGVLITKADDSALYDEVLSEAMRLIRASEELRVTVEKVIEKAEPKKPSTKKQEPSSLSKGFCIRCKTEIPPDPGKPYCRSCFASWNKFKNPDYVEKNCLVCGSANKSTITKPVCYSCFKTYKAELGL